MNSVVKPSEPGLLEFFIFDKDRDASSFEILPSREIVLSLQFKSSSRLVPNITLSA